MTKRDEWVRVKSNNELSTGTCVEIRPCPQCGRQVRMMIVAKDRLFEGLPTWHVSPPPCSGTEKTWTCFEGPIADGLLYRLADSQLTESETTRELERAR
jgi:hypothetical protein